MKEKPMCSYYYNTTYYSLVYDTYIPAILSHQSDIFAILFVVCVL